VFNENIFRKKSEFNKLLTDEYYKQFDKLVKVIRVSSIPKKVSVKAVLNGDEGRAVVYLE